MGITFLFGSASADRLFGLQFMGLFIGGMLLMALVGMIVNAIIGGRR
jgi:hypothetical protein